METITTNHQKSLNILNQQGFNIFPEVAKLIGKTIQESGIKTMNQADIAFLVNITTEELKENYRFLLFSEIEFAFKQGVRGRYGDYMGLNIRTFVKWLDAYLESDERDKVISQRKSQQVISASKQLTESVQYSDKHKRQIMIAAVNRKYDQFLARKLSEKQMNTVCKSNNLGRNIKRINEVPFLLTDYGNAIKNFLVRENKMQIDDKLENFFERCYSEKVEKIFDQQ